MIRLEGQKVSEMAGEGTVVGYLRINGLSNNRNIKFELTENAGGRFGVRDTLLIVKQAALINYEKQKAHSITVQATLSGGRVFRQDFSIRVEDENEAPKVIRLSRQQIPENPGQGQQVGEFTVVDEDSADTSTLRLIDSAQNAFKIEGRKLLVRDSTQIDYERHKVLNIQVRATDRQGKSRDKAFSIQVLDRNDAPTGVKLTSTHVTENTRAGTTVGTLETIDQDSADTHTYELTGANDGRFNIDHSRVVVAEHAFLDYEKNKRLKLRVKSTDNHGASVVQDLLIFVDNVNEAPQISSHNDLMIREDEATDDLLFQVGDPETKAEYLQLTVNSSNPKLFNSDNIQIVNRDALRSIRFIPTPNANGKARITVTVSDGTLRDSTKFNIKVLAVNDPPYLAHKPNIRLDEGSRKTFTAHSMDIRDVDNSIDEIRYTLKSQPSHGQISFDSTKVGTGFTFTQKDIESGHLSYKHDGSETTSDNIEFVVDDGSGGRLNSVNLPVHINPVNDKPLIGKIGDQRILEDASTRKISFMIQDAETPGVHLKISAESSNPALIDPSGIVLSGLGQIRTVRLRPKANQFGDAHITILLNDGEAVARRSFNLTVIPVNDPPQITVTPSIKSEEDKKIGPIPIKIFDQETEAGAMDLKFESSNEELIRPSNIQITGDGNQKQMVITPQPDKYGDARLTFITTDGLLTDTATTDIHIKAVNDPPTAFKLYGSKVELKFDSLHVSFDWEQAVDKENQAVKYLLNIKGSNIDTLIKNITKPRYEFKTEHRLESNTEYSWKVLATDGKDTTISASSKEFLTPTLPDLPQKFVLQKNYPNPFNPTTRLSYKIPATAHVRLAVYDMSGRVVEVLVNKVQSAGTYKVEWNASDQASGMYVSRLVAVGTQNHKQYIRTNKMLLIK